jgi:hypothetical protein
MNSGFFSPISPEDVLPGARGGRFLGHQASEQRAKQPQPVQPGHVMVGDDQGHTLALQASQGRRSIQRLTTDIAPGSRQSAHCRTDHGVVVDDQ